MDDPLLVRGFQRFGDLLGNGQRFVDWNGTSRNTVSERLAFDELHDERAYVGSGFSRTFFESVDRRDVRVIQGREDFRFALETGYPIRI
jgi:hypothetical protein